MTRQPDAPEQSIKPANQDTLLRDKPLEPSSSAYFQEGQGAILPESFTPIALTSHETPKQAAKRKTPQNDLKAKDQPHYHGHRERLRARFRDHGDASLPDYELLELLLFRAIPMRDVKPLAKTLLARFGSFADVLAAPPERLTEIKGLGQQAITELKLVEACAKRMTRTILHQRQSLGSWSELIDYCRTHMAFLDHEEFRLLFLDKKNHLIADEQQSRGTIDHTPVYPREIVKRALELGATALILVHNHPSGDPAPSNADVRMTKDIIAIAKPLGILVHDHVIIGRNGHASLKGLRLI